ncbi:MAG: type II toxin-antitoxin system RelB/DinJ family antitoxin [Lachnospiraceae bacterium]|jgi:addiction module RelB/DinJ family antitoxin|nr:type II toxin-antitoxin system RelB/DinJ family antitoxin [Lachnospiraceae bacterium]
MAQATYSIRMDEALKKQFDSLCTDFGMTATTAFNIFARTVVREKRIPFEITAPSDSGLSDIEVTRAKGVQSFLSLRKQAKESGLQGMSLADINEEIRKTRNGEDE